MFKKFFYSIGLSLGIICFFFSFNSNSDSSNSLSFPIHEKYYFSSLYGYRTLGNYHFHNGVDVPKTVGTNLYALSDGSVSYAGFSSSYGNTIIVSYYNGYKSLYGHTSGIYPFKVGDSVSSNNVIGYIGPKILSDGKLNGFTTGPHLHFTLYYRGKVIDPLSIKYL